ncbi:MAG: glycosyltransferase family 2 protein [Patescibacteria group bacterium]
MRDQSKIELSVIIVSWNTGRLIENCLKSIYKTVSHIDFEIIVIDNNSSDNTVQMIEKNFPNIILIKNNSNLGFASANNQGIARAKGDFLLLLNPDTILLSNSIPPSLEELKKDHKIAVLGAKILNPDLSLQPSCRRFPDLASQILILLKIHNLFPHLRPLKKYLMSDWPHNEKREVDQVMGAYFLTKREIIEEAGVLDEKYKLYFEEVDFCYRVKQMGYKVVFFPEAKIIHYQGESFKQVRGLKSQIYWNNSLRRYFKKYGRPFQYSFLTILYPISIFLALIVQVLIKLKIIAKK